MSKQQVRLASLLLQEGFGELVEGVGTYLTKHGSCLLGEIIRGTGLKPNQVKKCLCVLIQHQLVAFEAHTGGIGTAASSEGPKMYRVVLPNLLLRARLPKIIHAANVLFGDVGELIVEDLLHQGQSLMSQTIQRVAQQLEDAGGVERPNLGQVVKDLYVKMVQGCYLQRAHPPAPELMGTSPASLTVHQGMPTEGEFKPFELPPALDAITYSGSKRRRSAEGAGVEGGGEPSAKRKKTDTEQGGEPLQVVDSGIQWHVNFNRFNQYFIDQAIISAVAEQVDETAACVMRTILKLSGENLKGTSPYPATGPELYTLQIAEAMPDSPTLSRDALEQYLKTLVDEQVPFLRKAEDSGSGSYVVNYKHGCELLCTATVESVVRERFGSKALRIFRLLILKKALEQKQVVDMAMLSSKDARSMLYTLVTESFVTQLEIPRTPDYAPSRTFYLYSVNLPNVARIVLERCYKALGNLIAKRMAEMKDNRRLLEKYELDERQQQELGGEQVEVEEALTPDEREKVERVKMRVHRLENGELQLEETIATVVNYIQSHSQDS